MKQFRITMLALSLIVSMGAKAQEARTDTIVPRFLINGYFFRELPKLPKGTPSYTRLKDNEGNSLLAIGLDVDLPKSAIRYAIPKEQVHNADQFLKGANTMATMQELTQTNVKADGSFYSPKAGEQFPSFCETDMDGRTWTNDSVRGHVMVLNLWYSGCFLCHLPRCRDGQAHHRQAPFHMDAPRRGKGYDVVDRNQGVPSHHCC